MKPNFKNKIIILLSFFGLILLYSCSSSETATYNAGNNENWKINVLHQTGVTDNFKVIINDSTVINKNVSGFTGKLEETGTYREKAVKLVVTYVQISYGSGSFETVVYIENKLAAKFNF